MSMSMSMIVSECGCADVLTNNSDMTWNKESSLEEWNISSRCVDVLICRCVDVWVRWVDMLLIEGISHFGVGCRFELRHAKTHIKTQRTNTQTEKKVQRSATSQLPHTDTDVQQTYTYCTDRQLHRTETKDYSQFQYRVISVQQRTYYREYTHHQEKREFPNEIVLTKKHNKSSHEKKGD
jgi:hypothetical protein